MIDTSKWEKIDRTGLSGEKIDRLIEACAMAHRDSYSIGLACGIRCAFRLLAEIGGDRTKKAVRHVTLVANSCSSLAFMIICCVNVCKGNMDFTYSDRPDWQVEGRGEYRSVLIRMKPTDFRSAEEVFETPDDDLFDVVEVREITG